MQRRGKHAPTKPVVIGRGGRTIDLPTMRTAHALTMQRLDRLAAEQQVANHVDEQLTLRVSVNA